MKAGPGDTCKRSVHVAASTTMLTRVVFAFSIVLVVFACVLPFARCSPPFTGETPLDTYKQIVRGKYMVPSAMPKRAKDITQRLLVHSAEGRLGCMSAGTKQVRHSTRHRMDWCFASVAPPPQPRRAFAITARLMMNQTHAFALPPPSQLVGSWTCTCVRYPLVAAPLCLMLTSASF